MLEASDQESFGSETEAEAPDQFQSLIDETHTRKQRHSDGPIPRREFILR